MFSIKFFAGAELKILDGIDSTPILAPNSPPAMADNIGSEIHAPRVSSKLPAPCIRQNKDEPASPGEFLVPNLDKALLGSIDEEANFVAKPMFSINSSLVPVGDLGEQLIPFRGEYNSFAHNPTGTSVTDSMDIKAMATEDAWTTGMEHIIWEASLAQSMTWIMSEWRNNPTGNAMDKTPRQSSTSTPEETKCSPSNLRNSFLSLSHSIKA